MFDINRLWYRTSLHPSTILLWPLACLFGMLIFIRRWLYQIKLLKTYYFNVPVIVIGNITVGGTGKTPLVIWLAQFLQSRGYTPGIVSRGVGGKKHSHSYWVTNKDSALMVGDEAILLAKHSHCSVVINVDRVSAVRDLLAKTQCDVVISDDGLQHYRLGRTIEIAVIDGARGFGNHCLLPAGPLREPISRLRTVDFVASNGSARIPATTTFNLQASELISLQNPIKKVSLKVFPNKKVHAVAGIGHPERFFLLLKQLGFAVIAHAFPDHYHYQANDLAFADSLPILMTEKDAVKCRAFANERCWYVPVTINIDALFGEKVLAQLESHHEQQYKKNFSNQLPGNTHRINCD